MRITSLVENTTKSELKAKHGLSLYIETKVHKILFDLGPDNTLFENAVKKNIDISKVDTVIISHGHVDHGGALKKFLDINSMANIYIQKTAFEPHYSKTLFLKIPVGIHNTLKTNRQIILLDGDYKIDDELSLFTVNKTNKLYSPVNSVLYDKKGKDTFAHEQNLIITANGKRVLFSGCSHTGIVNIQNQAEKLILSEISTVVGGFHLYNPPTKKYESDEMIANITNVLEKKKSDYYTCHCTGIKAYKKMKYKLGERLHYLSTGTEILL